MIRICPERDGRCPHGMDCPFSIDRYSCDMEKSREALKAPGKAMTGISESGIEAAREAYGIPNGLFHADKLTAAIQAYLPFHPPASREEGLREAARIAAARKNNWTGSRDPDTQIQEAAKDEVAEDIEAAILALIPTKPEAKG